MDISGKMDGDNQKGEVYTSMTCEKCGKPIKHDSEVVLIESGIVEAAEEEELPYSGIKGNEVLEAFHWECYGQNKRSEIRPSALKAKKSGRNPSDGVPSAE